MRYFLLILLLCFSLNAFAQDEEIYAVDEPDGSVYLIHYFPNDQKPIEQVMIELGKNGQPFRRIQASDIPQDANGKKIDRKYWKRSGNKIIVDQTKKNDDLAIEAQKKAERDAVLAKLKINEDELKKLIQK